MLKIPSFTINHTALTRGIYLSRTDGDVITLDLRMRRPYKDAVLSPVQLHSLEHLLAAGLRGGAWGAHILYVGPMGCATGFYVLVKELSEAHMLAAVKAALTASADAALMPGNSSSECGNVHTLDLNAGKLLAAEYLLLLQDKSHLDAYPS